jgi:hypothetical protein
MSTDLEKILADIREQLASLSDRLARVEAGAGPASAQVRTEAPAPEASGSRAKTEEAGRPGIGEEELLAISAALAAYFGVQVHIRQIRLISSPAWSQQGRVWVQASHHLER